MIEDSIKTSYINRSHLSLLVAVKVSNPDEDDKMTTNFKNFAMYLLKITNTGEDPDKDVIIEYIKDQITNADSSSMAEFFRRTFRGIRLYSCRRFSDLYKLFEIPYSILRVLLPTLRMTPEFCSMFDWPHSLDMAQTKSGPLQMHTRFQDGQRSVKLLHLPPPTLLHPVQRSLPANQMQSCLRRRVQQISFVPILRYKVFLYTRASLISAS